MTYDYNHIKALKNLLVAKGIITEEEYDEEVLRVTWEISQSMKIESAQITFEEYKKRRRMRELKKK